MNDNMIIRCTYFSVVFHLFYCRMICYEELPDKF
jgi:hypothetical protein